MALGTFYVIIVDSRQQRLRNAFIHLPAGSLVAWRSPSPDVDWTIASDAPGDFNIEFIDVRDGIEHKTVETISIDVTPQLWPHTVTIP